jgi:hypothetical protein
VEEDDKLEELVVVVIVEFDVAVDVEPEDDETFATNVKEDDENDDELMVDDEVKKFVVKVESVVEEFVLDEVEFVVVDE